MNRSRPRLLSVFWLVLLGMAACSHPEPRKEETRHVYHFTHEYMWEQLQEELRESWRVESQDPDTGVLVTDWDVQLHAMNTFGRRHRLTVTLSGTDGEGYKVVAEQETEQNTNQMNPLALSEADWDPIQSDGALANAFLYKFHRRVNPPQPWREELGR